MYDMLQKLEDKVITLVEELENMRSKMANLVRENQALREEATAAQATSGNSEEKLRGILSLLEDAEREMTKEHEVA